MASVHKREWVTGKDVKRMSYQVRWTENGKQQSESGFRLKKEAEDFKREVETRLRNGSGGRCKTSITVEEACREYMRAAQDRAGDGRIGQHHLRSMTYAVERSIIPHLGKHRLSALTPPIVEDFYRAMVREGSVSAMTARQRVAMLGRIEDYGIRREWTPRSSAREAKKELRGLKRKPVRTFTLAELNRLLAYVDSPKPSERPHSHLFRRALVNVAAFCGLRYGEIVGLTIGNVDLERRMLHVRHSLSAHDGLKAPKTEAGIRDVPMPAHVAHILRMWIEQYHTPNPLDLVFQHGRTRPSDGANFHTNHWRPLLRRAGLEDESGDHLHFHSLRHFAASWWCAGNLPMPDVASLLGHSKFDMTLQVYAHPVVGGNKRHEMIDRMAQLLIGSPEPASSQALPALEGPQISH